MMKSKFPVLGVLPWMFSTLFWFAGTAHAAAPAPEDPASAPSVDDASADVQEPTTETPSASPDVAAPPPAPERPAASRQVGPETICDDGKDNDGDVVFDCGDADCKGTAACTPDGEPENTEGRCGDWLDNDSDGYTDCDDVDCNGTTICQGSWDRPAASGITAGTGNAGVGASSSPETFDEAIAEDVGGGERDNVTCSDGIDNDNDGQVDCDDYGCKLETSVTVCQPPTDFRFSVVGRVAQSYEVQDQRVNTTFDVLQLRALGQMPFIQNSFFLISMRAEKTPRLTFAMFQVPIGKKGHYVNINSGGGGLSLTLVQSVHKRLLADPAFYVYNAFEQGNGAALEFGGPIDRRGKFLYRTFIAGGSGRFAGNIGGTFFPDEDENYTWSVGGQIWMNLIGYRNRWDTPFLYTPQPLALSLAVGAKYDQRAQERYPAANVQMALLWRRLLLTAENYTKRELEFQNWQTAYNVQLGVLAISKRLMLAADFGQYLATDFEQQPEFLGFDLRRQLQELQYRGAAHVYLWRDIFYASLVWRDRRIEPTPAQEADGEGIQVQQDLRLLFTYRW